MKLKTLIAVLTSAAAVATAHAGGSMPSTQTLTLFNTALTNAVALTNTGGAGTVIDLGPMFGQNPVPAVTLQFGLYGLGNSGESQVPTNDQRGFNVSVDNVTWTTYPPYIFTWTPAG